MLTAGDEYPIHQTPEPVALVTDRNFYDRFFFNGYAPDGSAFFAAAMGVYPALDVIDGAFCVSVDGKQHNLRVSARLGGDRMAMHIGPISISVDVPLSLVTLKVTANDGPLAAELTFTGRHFPVEEPRFTRRNGTRLFMDYTRMTQNGRWSGWISVDGQRIAVDQRWCGTRDRSWGIRPVGKPDPQPAPMEPQFFWVWTPCNFEAMSLYCHTNDDGNGLPWNRRAVICADAGGPGDGRDFEAPAFTYQWVSGGRRIAAIGIDLAPDHQLTLAPIRAMGGSGHFYMNGLGYTHPIWGHGTDHGHFDMAYDMINHAAVADGDYANMHVQALAQAELRTPDAVHRGMGVIEQMFIGPHAASGLAGLFDPHP